jgi:prepilin-type N-terminal cleavage/methylation domain-containing protein
MTKGFTLIEVLVVILIFTFIMAALFGMLNLGNATFNTDIGILELQQGCRRAMEGMSREIRQNRSADINITDDSGATVNPGTRINFRLPGSSYCYRYSLISGSIIRQILDCSSSSEQASLVLADNIDALIFSVSGSVIQLQLRARKTIGQRVLLFPQETGSYLTEKVWLRN